MTTNSGPAGAPDPVDSVLEALLKELIENGSNPKTASRAGDAVTAALAEAQMAAVARTVSQASEFERALFVATLAPALAEALAPLLAEALAPALVTALSQMAGPKKIGQESASSKSGTKH